MSLVPTPDALPMAAGYFDVLLLLTFPLHLLLMNAMVGGTLIALRSHLRRDPVHERLAYKIAQALPLLIAFTINLGVAPLLFVQVLYGHLLYTSSIMMGVFWLGVIPVLLIAYAAAYFYDFKFWSLGRRGLPVLMVAGALMLTIGFMFSNNMTLMLTPESWGAYFAHSDGVFLNLLEPTLWPRYVHMMIGAIAVGGLAIACLGRLWAKEDQQVAELANSVGMRQFFIATCVQIVAGIWFLLSLPADIMLLFMGRNLLASAVFILALACVIAVLVFAWKKALGWTSLLAVVLVYLMSFMRAFVRGGYVDNLFVTQLVETNQDFSPLMLFVVTLVVGLILIAWMVRAVLCAREH